MEGQISPAGRAALTQHLEGCEACRALVATLAGSMLEVRGSAETLHEPAAPPSPPLEPGTRVGRYAIVSVLGSGAMGTVYAAEDPELHRKVALKLLRPEVSRAEGRGLGVRLLREAQAMARLSHPGVITVHDVGTFEGQSFVAMELVEGGTLRGWLLAAPRSWQEILALFLRAGRGLAAAHAGGLVHRDFKPDNVLVGADGRVRVTDFGLVRASARAGPAPPPAIDEEESGAPSGPLASCVVGAAP